MRKKRVCTLGKPHLSVRGTCAHALRCSAKQIPTVGAQAFIFSAMAASPRAALLLLTPAPNLSSLQRPWGRCDCVKAKPEWGRCVSGLWKSHIIWRQHGLTKMYCVSLSPCAWQCQNDPMAPKHIQRHEPFLFAAKARHVTSGTENCRQFLYTATCRGHGSLMILNQNGLRALALGMNYRLNCLAVWGRRRPSTPWHAAFSVGVMNLPSLMRNILQCTVRCWSMAWSAICTGQSGCTSKCAQAES